MKILYICSDVEIPVFGREGCSIHVREFANALAGAKHDVRVLCSWLGGPPPPDMKARVQLIEPEGLEARAWAALEEDPTVVNHFLDRDLKSVLFNGWLQKEAAGIPAEEKPDVIYERYALFGWSGLALSRQLDVPLILEINAPVMQEQEGYERFTLMHTAERMEIEILQGADALIAVSSVVKDWLISRGVSGDRVMVIPNAVSNQRFEHKTNGAAVRERHGLAARRVIGFVGSFQPWHDPAGLVRAFARVRQKHANAQLLMVGNGPQRDELVALVKKLGLAEAVTFTGSVPHADIPDYLAAMDIAAAPYPEWTQPFYGSPMKIFEYMAAARPMVAAALGQIGEVIEHKKTGWLYTPGDEEGLVEGLERMLADPAAAEAMGAAARETALREHSWNAVVTKVMKRTRMLIEQRRKKAR